MQWRRNYLDPTIMKQVISYDPENEIMAEFLSFWRDLASYISRQTRGIRILFTPINDANFIMKNLTEKNPV